MHHDLKSLSCFFQPVVEGRKTFEIRSNLDRGFNAGDTFTLHELDVNSGELLSRTGNTVSGRITYVLDYEQKPGFVVFGFKLDQPFDHELVARIKHLEDGLHSLKATAQIQNIAARVNQILDGK